MSRGMIWLFGALALSALLIFALSGICSNTSFLPALSGYFCPRPRPLEITLPPNPSPPAGGETERGRN